MTQELQAELHQGVLVRFFGGFYVAADADGQEYTLRCPKNSAISACRPLWGMRCALRRGRAKRKAGWWKFCRARPNASARPWQM